MTVTEITSPLTDIDKYFALVTFLMPGIIMIQLRRCVTPVRCNYFSTEFINFVQYTILNTICYVLLSNIFKWGDISNFINMHDSLYDNLNYYICFIFIIPFILGFFIGWSDKLKILQRILGFLFQKKVASNIFTTWEEYFGAGNNKSADIVIKLKNGDTIHGYFGENSMISGSITNKDIYLEKVTKINDMMQLEETSAWINGNDIEYILLSNGEISEKFILTQISEGISFILDKLEDLRKILHDLCTYIKKNKKYNTGQNRKKKRRHKK